MPDNAMTGTEMTFAPIAIVGRSCVLPGALNPDELWRRVRAGDDLTSRAPDGRWRVPYDDVRSDKPGDVKAARGRTWTDIGGYVEYACCDNKVKVMLRNALPQTRFIDVIKVKLNKIVLCELGFRIREEQLGYIGEPIFNRQSRGL